MIPVLVSVSIEVVRKPVTVTDVSVEIEIIVDTDVTTDTWVDKSVAETIT